MQIQPFTDFVIGEQRVWPRIQTNLTALYADSEGFFHEEMVLNLSKGGLFVKTQSPLPKGERLELILALPDQTCEVTVQGQIMHSFGDGPAQDRGMGIMFTTIEPVLKNWLGHFINRLMEVKGGGVRSAPRIHTPPCRIQVSGADGQKNAVLYNLSPNGMFIHTQEPLSLFEKVNTTLLNPKTLESLSVSGEVVHIRKLAGGDGCYGAGIRFVDLDGETEIVVAEMVKEILIERQVSPLNSTLAH